MTDAQLLKQVTIKTGVVKRYVKDLTSYKKEIERETAKLESMKAKPDTDPYLVKKQAEVVQESSNMIPDTERRIQKALDDLRTLLEDNASILAGTKEYTAAKEQMELATAQ